MAHRQGRGGLIIQDVVGSIGTPAHLEKPPFRTVPSQQNLSSLVQGGGVTGLPSRSTGGLPSGQVRGGPPSEHQLEVSHLAGWELSEQRGRLPSEHVAEDQRYQHYQHHHLTHLREGHQVDHHLDWMLGHQDVLLHLHHAGPQQQPGDRRAR